MSLIFITERKSGPFFIPKYTGMGKSCWEKGCNFEQSQEFCETADYSYGKLARINSPTENYLVGQLVNNLNGFGPFDPSKRPKQAKTYYWFYNALYEDKSSSPSTYRWPTQWPSQPQDQTVTNYTNW